MKLLRTIIFILAVTAVSCEDRGQIFVDDDNPAVPCRSIIKQNACGKSDIGNSLEWLNELIVTSFNDKTGKYKGKIWVKSYNNIDYIITDMPITDGFTGYHVFECDGTETVINDNSFFASLTNKYLIWISHCPQPGVTD